MPAYTRNVKRDNLVFVPCNTKILYGFKTKDLASLASIDAGDVAALGHLTATAAAAQAGKILVIGASAPKPPRVRRLIPNAAAGTQQSVSSFASKTALGTAISAGWTLAKPGNGVSLQAPSAQSGSVTAIATLSNGAKYCFSMNKADYDTYAAALGLENSLTITTTAERDALVRGSSQPKAGRASIKTSAGGSFSSFYSTAADLGTAGFNVLSEEIVIASAPANP